MQEMSEIPLVYYKKGSSGLKVRECLLAPKVSIQDLPQASAVSSSSFAYLLVCLLVIKFNADRALCL